MYILVDKTNESAHIFKDKQQIATYLGKSRATIWRYCKRLINGKIEKETFVLYEANTDHIKSNRGGKRKKSYQFRGDMSHF